MISMVDLHIHSNASDGRFSPEDIVRKSAQLGLAVISLTDHDTLDGIIPALTAVEAFPQLKLIPGVEINTDVPDGEAHVLGYFIDYADQRLRSTLEKLRNSRRERAEKMVAKLRRLGMYIDLRRVKEIAGEGSIGRPHIAQALLEKGYIASLKEAFVKYVGRNGPAYVEREKIAPAEAVRLVLQARGLPVLAHPPTVNDPKAMIIELKPVGLVGIEAYYGGYSAEEMSKLAALAEKGYVVSLETAERVLEPQNDLATQKINADDVWQMKDASGTPVTGTGIEIGIIDTGVDYTYPDLGGCLGVNCKVIGGYDFVNEDSDPMDDFGHGTHVAAIAAGNGTLKGVAPDAKIYAYKVLDNYGSGYSDDIIAAIERAADPNQDYDFSDHLDVINLSLGGEGDPDDPMSQAIDNAAGEGVVAAVAAGNWGSGLQSIASPGTAKKAITVAASDKQDVIASFSSRGPVIWNDQSIVKPDITAPGVSICAAEWDNWLSDYRCLDDKHIAISGTSMAAPHIAVATA